MAGVADVPAGTAPGGLTRPARDDRGVLQDRQHGRHIPSRGSTAVITSLMFLVPLSAASMFRRIFAVADASEIRRRFYQRAGSDGRRGAVGGGVAVSGLRRTA